MTLRRCAWKLSSGLAALLLSAGCGDTVPEEFWKDVPQQTSSENSVEGKHCLDDELVSIEIHSIHVKLPQEYLDALPGHLDFLERLTGAENIQKIKGISYEGCALDLAGRVSRGYIFLGISPNFFFEYNGKQVTLLATYPAGWFMQGIEHVVNHEYGHILFQTGVLGEAPISAWSDRELFVAGVQEPEEYIVNTFGLFADYVRLLETHPEVDPFIENRMIPYARENPGVVGRFRRFLDDPPELSYLRYAQDRGIEDIFNRQLDYFIEQGVIPADYRERLVLSALIPEAQRQYDQQKTRALATLDGL